MPLPRALAFTLIATALAIAAAAASVTVAAAPDMSAFAAAHGPAAKA